MPPYSPSTQQPSAPQDVADMQQAILRALRKGRVFSRVHKEGGTTLRCARGGFVREDYGDNPGVQRFASEEAFLAAVRQFHDHEIACEAGSAPLTEEQAWRWIHARLDPQAAGAGAGALGRLRRATVFVAVCALSFGIAWLKVQPGAEWRRPGAASATPVLTLPPGGMQPDPERLERLREGERRTKERLQAIVRDAAR